MSTTEDAQQATIMAARAKLRAAMGVPQRHKGSVRTAPRPTPAVQSRGESDKVKNALKKLNLQHLPGVDEVILRKGDDKAFIFKNPRVSLNLHSNTTVVTGQYVEGNVPGDDFLSKMREISSNPAALAAATGLSLDDEIPTLVEDFEAVADKDTAKIEEVD